MTDRPLSLTVPQLKARGWTEAMIRTFLGVPDVTSTNPHYRTGPPMRRYWYTRVLACEATPAFGEAQAKAQVRQARGLAVAQRKATEIRAWVDALEIRVPVLAPEVLVQRACAHYNRAAHVPDWVLERDWSRQEATPESSPAFLARITVNYLRHQLTRYEVLLDRTYGKVGADAARQTISQKIYQAIAAAYPVYAQECTRQYQARWAEQARWAPVTPAATAADAAAVGP